MTRIHTVYKELISDFILFFERVNCLSKEMYKLICSLGQVKFSMDKSNMAIYLSLDKKKILLFPHPCLTTYNYLLVALSYLA